MLQQMRGWLKREPMGTWFPFWVGLISMLVGYGLGSDGSPFFPRQDKVWAAMQERGTWRVGIDPSFPPFEFLDESGRPSGFDPDLAATVAERWGMTLEIVPIGFDSLVDAVQTDQIDSVVSALPYDPRLTKNLSYSQPYFDAGVLLVVREDSPLLKTSEVATFERAEDAPLFLSGKQVGVEWGGMGDMIGRRYQRQLTAENQPELELVAFSTPQEAVDGLLNNRELDAIIIDNVTLHQMKSQAPLIGLGPILESNPYVIASPENAPLLSAEIEKQLALFSLDGTIDRLIQKWFGS